MKEKLDWDRFKGQFSSTWQPKMKKFIESKECWDIYKRLKDDGRPIEMGGNGLVICPDSADVFKTFKESQYDNLKVVWLLLDPYPTVKTINNVKTKVANGVAMDCRNTGMLQPSLELFYGAMEDEYQNPTFVRNPSLEYLLIQGSLMLNTSLTVEKDKSGSHSELWEPFMKYMFEEVFGLYDRGLIFVLCGKESHKWEGYINPMQHYIFKLEHPAAAARQKRDWRYEGIFKKIDRLLVENNKEAILWNYNDFIKEIPF